MRSMSKLALLRSSIRSYATDAPKSRLGATLSLDHVSGQQTYAFCLRLSLISRLQFLQRSRTLSFYRNILRGTKRIKDLKTRAETSSFVRAEFERHRGVTDLVRLNTAQLAEVRRRNVES
jgi:hypothetical protein